MYFSSFFSFFFLPRALRDIILSFAEISGRKEQNAGARAQTPTTFHYIYTRAELGLRNGNGGGGEVFFLIYLLKSFLKALNRYDDVFFSGFFLLFILYTAVAPAVFQITRARNDIRAD